VETEDVKEGQPDAAAEDSEQTEPKQKPAPAVKAPKEKKPITVVAPTPKHKVRQRNIVYLSILSYV